MVVGGFWATLNDSALPNSPHRRAPERHFGDVPACCLGLATVPPVSGLTVVLVHGGWHAAWCWEWLTPLLDETGIRHVTLDLPFAGHESDVAATTSLLDEIDGPKILVGHSYGGLVISGAAQDRTDVAHLLYVAAFLCPSDRAVLEDLAGVQDPIPVFAAARFANGSWLIDSSKASEVFYAECPREIAAEACSRLRPFGTTDAVRALGEPWRTVPSTYVVCARDRAIRPDAQRHMAQLASHVIEMDTDHSPFISRRERLRALIDDVHGSIETDP